MLGVYKRQSFVKFIHDPHQTNVETVMIYEKIYGRRCTLVRNEEFEQLSNAQTEEKAENLTQHTQTELKVEEENKRLDSEKAEADAAKIKESVASARKLKSEAGLRDMPGEVWDNLEHKCTLKQWEYVVSYAETHGLKLSSEEKKNKKKKGRVALWRRNDRLRVLITEARVLLGASPSATASVLPAERVDLAGGADESQEEMLTRLERQLLALTPASRKALQDRVQGY